MELRTSSPAALPRAERKALLERLRSAFLGLDTAYPLVDGTTRRRTYLDSAASNLCLKPAYAVAREAMAHYANTHSHLHHGARIMTALYDRAHELALEFVGASDEYTAVFCGNGVTGCLNRMARVLKEKRPERGVVLTTIMEHHANDLPHRKHVGEVVHVPVEKDPDGEAGRVDMAALRKAVRAYRDRLNYVAVTAASNVTGITNPIHEIAELAHRHGALVVVDAAQSAAHIPLSVEGEVPEEAIDVLCLSGHKIYTPGSPGVIVARKGIFAGLEPQEVGGGVVDTVDTRRYEILDKLPEREETGTPNLPGAIALGATLRVLQEIGMDVVEEDERELTQYALSHFDQIPGLHLYGSHRLEIADRIGVLTFNLVNLPHGLVAAALNDYFGIAVRNECFCAQPFVRQLLGISGDDGVAPESCFDTCTTDDQPGMVRVSFGLYNTREDVDVVVEALTEIASNAETFREAYFPVYDGSGDWRHKTFRYPLEEAFTIDGAVERQLQRVGLERENR